jgi:HEAT repeat protein
VSPDELPGVIEPMLKDRFMPVRRDALWYAASKRPDIAKPILQAAMLDNHISMRETARQFLLVVGIKSARDFYVDAIGSDSDKQRFAAICGLGETGSKADLLLVAPFLDSPLTKIRRAAVYSIGRLDLEGQLARLVGTLCDVKPSVSRQALKALQLKARYIPVADLENLFSGEADFHVRRNIFTLILCADKWKKVPAILKACADKDTRIAEQATKALRAWFANYNRSFAEPSPDDFQRISSALSQFESHLPKKLAVELRACLKIYFN